MKKSLLSLALVALATLGFTVTSASAAAPSFTTTGQPAPSMTTLVLDNSSPTATLEATDVPMIVDAVSAKADATSIWAKNALAEPSETWAPTTANMTLADAKKATVNAVIAKAWRAPAATADAKKLVEPSIARLIAAGTWTTTAATPGTAGASLAETRLTV